MKYYSIMENTPFNTDWVEDYIEPTNEAIKRHGGKILTRTASHERLEGEGDSPAFIIIIEWPSEDAAKAFLNDPEYASHFKARSEGSDTDHYLILAKDDLA